MTRSRWYVVGAVLSGGLLVTGLVTGTIFFRRSVASYSLDPAGFALGTAMWALICLSCIFGAFRAR